jgi:hypothetical protein
MKKSWKTFMEEQKNHQPRMISTKKVSGFPKFQETTPEQKRKYSSFLVTAALPDSGHKLKKQIATHIRSQISVRKYLKVQNEV